MLNGLLTESAQDLPVDNKFSENSSESAETTSALAVQGKINSPKAMTARTLKTFDFICTR
jgi:hypothetical protein